MESHKKKSDILILGDVSGAFWDSTELDGIDVQRCVDIDQGITLASSNNYTKIIVVMSSLNGNLESTLEKLRLVSNGAKLVLLSQMYEEPVARQMLKSFRRPGNPVDEYHICPIAAKSIMPQMFFRNRVKEQPARPAATSITIQKPVEEAVSEQVETPISKTTMMQDMRIRELEKLATEDDLTGLKNRRYAWEFLRQILVRGKAEGFNASLLIFDIDNFKHYNDAYGHAVGDNVLVQTATMMKRCWREHDVIARIGGDEFAVVFWDRPDKENEHTEISQPERRNKTHSKHPEEAMFIAERFRKEMNATDLCMLGTDGKGTLTISGGLASFPRDGSTAEELFEKADEAMMEAKRSGKNGIWLVGK